MKLRACVKPLLAAALAAVLLLSFSACSVIRNIKENANKPAPPLLDTPADDTLADVYRAALETSVRECKEIKEKTALNVSDPRVSDGSGEKDTALLNAAAKQLTGLIMKNGPGSAENTYTAANARESMLYAVLSGQFLQTVSERDKTVSKLSDGNGNDVLDENGEPVTEENISNNDLRIVFRMYEETPAAETAEGETEAEGTRAVAEDSAIEAVFGPARDKAELLAECEAVKDYLQVTDYTFEYQDCFVTVSLDMDTNRISAVTFEKHVAVTAPVTGAGPLAGYGAFTVTFDLTEKTEYVFTYPTED